MHKSLNAFCAYKRTSSVQENVPGELGKQYQEAQDIIKKEKHFVAEGFQKTVQQFSGLQNCTFNLTALIKVGCCF